MGKENLHIFRGELALALAVIINSFGVVLMLYSGAGISAISSVPYAFSEVIPKVSLGTWTYIFQGLLVLSLMILRKKFVPQYLFSFVLGFIFSELLDVHKMWIDILPTDLGWCVLYFVVSYFLLCIGIALSNRCKLPKCYPMFHQCQLLPWHNVQVLKPHHRFSLRYRQELHSPRRISQLSQASGL